MQWQSVLACNVAHRSSSARPTVAPPGTAPHLNSLRLGDIELRDVAALIAPAMDGDDVLLGMSALKQLEFSQKGGTLVLRQTVLPRH